MIDYDRRHVYIISYSSINLNYFNLPTRFLEIVARSTDYFCIRLCLVCCVSLALLFIYLPVMSNPLQERRHNSRLCFGYSLHLVLKVLAEICNDGSRCSVGEHCCTIGCCYDSSDDLDDDRRYSYGYRLSIWNMWYFWFVILFLMMSCFGGCGYYKHRQRLIGGQPVRGHRNFLSILTEPYNGGATRVLTVERGGYPENMGYVLSRGTDANLAASMAPPPYAEVMNNPGLFPPNTKTGVPGDMPQGGQTNLGTIHNEPTNQMPQPPPYTEVANQNETGSIPTNQNVQNQSQLTNQVPEITVSHQ